MNRAIKKSDFYTISASNVEYLPSFFDGKVDLFNKLDEYAWQKEWRLAIGSNTKEPFKINVGSIEDISKKIKISEFKNKMVEQNKELNFYFS
ncbi:MAG: hypothetical protein HON42_03665 [Alphaproteobacteria bacterium]|nr:hypothetical protein [Alphaproteobacteria bacterium]